MKHGNKKAKFGKGQDANEMLMRKMAYNFFMNGKIVTTETKAKALKSFIEKLTEKVKQRTQSNELYLRRYVTNDDVVDYLYNTVSPTVQERNGGYVRISRLYQRITDGTMMTRMSWTSEVPLITKESKKAKVQPEVPQEEPKAKKAAKKAAK
jgi:large subunit ribosomal protein L17